MGRADEARELPGDAPLGDQPTLGERRRHHGRRAHPTQIAGQRHGYAHPGDGPVDRGDDRFGHRHQVGVRAAQVGPGVRISGRGDAGADDLAGRPLTRPAVTVGIGDLGEHPEVGPGAPTPSGTRDDDAHHRRVALGFAESRGDLVTHAGRPGVELVRSVERDRGDRIVDLVEDLLEGGGHPRVVAGRAAVPRSEPPITGGRRGRAAGRPRRDGGSPHG